MAREDWERVNGRPVRLLLTPPHDLPGDRPHPLNLPILFLHGLGCNCYVWEPTLRAMAEQGICCQAVAPDMPGYGRSPGPRQALGMPALAEWCTHFLDARGLSRVHLVGNSMGCQVALELAVRYPQRVGAVVVQGPTTGTRVVPRWRYILGLFADSINESLSYDLRLLTMYAQMGLPRYLATVEKMLAEDVFDIAPHIATPTLVIRGGRDAIIGERVAKKLTATLPKGEYYPLDHAAHAIEYNHPKEFTEAVLNFLTKAEGTLGIGRQEADAESGLPVSE